MVDAERILARLDDLAPLLEVLEEVRDAGEGRLRRDLRIQLQTAHALQLAIQICLDVGAHLVAERGLEPPADYAGVFQSLAAAGIIEDQLGARLSKAAGMRNLLVHEYTAVDWSKVWDALANLDDLRAFASAAARVAEE